jgi:hypothetical protein
LCLGRATGHEFISGIAIEKWPDNLPAFIRTPEAVAEIAVMGRELDHSKGAGETHDKERDPGHNVLLVGTLFLLPIILMCEVRFWPILLKYSASRICPQYSIVPARSRIDDSTSLL